MNDNTCCTVFPTKNYKFFKIIINQEKEYLLKKLYISCRFNSKENIKITQIGKKILEYMILNVLLTEK